MRGTMRRLPAIVAPSVVLLARTAFAQGALPVQQPEMPPAIEVTDPMLTPVPRAAKEIATWEDALHYVRARSTDLRIAADQVLRAEAQQRVALAGALPTINGQAGYTHNLLVKDVLQPTGYGANGVEYKTYTTPTPNYVNGQIVASQPVLAPRAWYGIGTARIASDASRLSFDDAKRQIALSVANSIVGVVTAERVAELNRVGLRNALARVELTTRKAALGSSNGLDVVRTRQDVEVARATLVAGDESLRQAREALGLALGVAEGIGVPPNVDISGLETDARRTCKPTDSIDQRSDVAALRTRVEVARRTVNDAKLQFSPTVNAQSAFATSSVSTGLSPSTTWNVGAVLSVPIFEGGVRYGNLRDTRAQQDIAEQNLEASRRQASIQVTQAERGVTVAEDRRRVAAASRDLAAETDRLTRFSYQEGRGTSLELITAAQALREAEIQLALRDFDLVKARVLAVLARATCPF